MIPIHEFGDRTADLTVLHRQNMDGLLTELGPWFVERWYRGTIADPTTLGFAIVEEALVIGTAIGSPRPDRQFDALTSPFVPFTAQILRALTLRPRLALRIVGARLSGSGAADLDEDEVELTYVMVASAHRGRGLGRRLVERYCEAAARAGYRQVVLSVARQNPARRLYERLGFELREELREGGFDRLRLARAI